DRRGHLTWPKAPGLNFFPSSWAPLTPWDLGTGNFTPLPVPRTSLAARKPHQVSPALVRSFSSTARNRFENRVAEKQKLFQADNDLPVHLKGGATDNILYRVTMGLCLGGTAYSLYCLGWASFPHKK
uniref:Cytochrome c oxidase subunit 7A1, mitochondrial n=1 Tax=Equus asinus TaxID=9793 RepID=A0A9L0KG59_EQUAS